MVGTAPGYPAAAVTPITQAQKSGSTATLDWDGSLTRTTPSAGVPGAGGGRVALVAGAGVY